MAKERNTNLELLRVILMYLIVAHHFVVNSGIRELYNFDIAPMKSIFLDLWGMWGKTGINVFVLISGYFMCTSSLTWKRFLKIWIELKFYNIIIFVIFLIAGYETVTFKRIFSLLFGSIYNINKGFNASFLAFYLFIPFYNFLIEKLKKEQLFKLIMLLLLIFTAASSFFFNGSAFYHVGWYMTLYYIAAYIRLYPAKWMKSSRLTGIGLVFSIVLSWLSVICINYLRYKFGLGIGSYYLVSDSHKILALTVSVFTFLWFSNIKVKQSKTINTIATTTYGVLLIHANSAAMRKFLWKDLLNVPSMFEYPIGRLVVCAIVYPMIIFAVCSLIDLARIRFVEKPVFNWINKNTERIEISFVSVKEFGINLIKKIDEKLEKYY